MTVLTPEQEGVIETFIKRLDAFWLFTRPQRTGYLFPDAAIVVKAQLSRWLCDSQILKDATTWDADGFGGWLKNPEWLVVCDASNNPPKSQAENRLHARVVAKMYRQIVSHDLKD